MRITDAVDVTTIKDNMKVVKLLRSSALEVLCPAKTFRTLLPAVDCTAIAVYQTATWHMGGGLVVWDSLRLALRG